MSKIDEMVETVRRSLNLLPNRITDQMIRTAIIAVFDKHVKAMLAEAAWFGECRVDYLERGEKCISREAYAERVISELTDQPNRNDRAV